MRFLIALALLVGGDEFTGFKAGTTWEYDSYITSNAQEEAKGVSTAEVVKNEDGKMYCELSDPIRGKLAFALFTVDNSLRWASTTNGNFTPTLLLHKFDAKVGDTWSGMLVDSPVEATVTFVGTESLMLPIGVVKDVIHTHVAMMVGNDKIEFHYYIAPKFGIVKMTAKLPAWEASFSLKSFKEAK